MEKTCANHPESMALAKCKACEKSICLMCVQDEKDGTFCSDSCVRMFREVAGWVDPSDSPAPAEPASASAPEPDSAPSTASVFEEMPESGAAAATAEATPEATAAVQTPRAGIGNPCATHPDIRAKAFCATCKRAICGLCIVETAAGMFCSDKCSRHLAGKKSSPAVKAVVVLLLLAVGGGGVWYALKEMEKNASTANSFTKPPDPIPVKPDPVKPDPVKPPPVKPDPIKPDPVKPPPVKPDPVKPDPVKPPVKPDPIKPVAVKPVVKPEAPKQTRLIHPWAGEEPGTWFRVKTTQGGRDTYTDFGLKSRTDQAYVLLVQASTGGKAGPVQEQRNDLVPTVILGEEMLEIEGRPYPCEIRVSRGPDGSVGRSWVLIQGRHSGAVIRNETSEGKFLTQRVWEHSPRVNGRLFECLVVEGEIEGGSGRQSLKTWFCSSLPLGAVKIETGATSVTLVDHGDDWAQRPPFPK